MKDPPLDTTAKLASQAARTAGPFHSALCRQTRRRWAASVCPLPSRAVLVHARANGPGGPDTLGQTGKVLKGIYASQCDVLHQLCAACTAIKLCLTEMCKSAMHRRLCADPGHDHGHLSCLGVALLHDTVSPDPSSQSYLSPSVSLSISRCLHRLPRLLRLPRPLPSPLPPPSLVPHVALSTSFLPELYREGIQMHGAAHQPTCHVHPKHHHPSIPSPRIAAPAAQRPHSPPTPLAHRP